MREQIKQIIIEEFSRVVNLIENDFKSNYDRKVNNFLLTLNFWTMKSEFGS